tara:strand:- start:323 stop:457 length:135 start_codon:yes stop_codon:yes gene_type:complete
MTHKSLKKRIETARKRIAQCPAWVQRSMVWQGGGETRKQKEGQR